MKKILLLLILIFICTPLKTKAGFFDTMLKKIKENLGNTSSNTKEVNTKLIANNNYCFTLSMKLGDNNKDVKPLQTLLSKEYNLYPEKIISGYFGKLTQAAIVRFQLRYKSEILTPAKLTNPTGNVGAFTLKKLNELSGCHNEPAVIKKENVTPLVLDIPKTTETIINKNSILEDHTDISLLKEVTKINPQITPEKQINTTFFSLDKLGEFCNQSTKTYEPIVYTHDLQCVEGHGKYSLEECRSIKENDTKAKLFLNKGNEPFIPSMTSYYCNVFTGSCIDQTYILRDTKGIPCDFYQGPYNYYATEGGIDNDCEKYCTGPEDNLVTYLDKDGDPIKKNTAQKRYTLYKPTIDDFKVCHPTYYKLLLSNSQYTNYNSTEEMSCGNLKINNAGKIQVWEFDVVTTTTTTTIKDPNISDTDSSKNNANEKPVKMPWDNGKTDIIYENPQDQFKNNSGAWTGGYDCQNIDFCVPCGAYCMYDTLEACQARCK